MVVHSEQRVQEGTEKSGKLVRKLQKNHHAGQHHKGEQRGNHIPEPGIEPCESAGKSSSGITEDGTGDTDEEKKQT